jgi:hypothetical protein
MLARRSCRRAPRGRSLSALALMPLLLFGCGDHGAPLASSWQGRIPGTKSWRLPPTPNGLQPTQCWFSIGSAPDGAMYIGASDHRTNSALYRLDTSSDVLRYVGDAKAASQAANNWLPDETAEKFHNRPLSYQGRVYVATTDYSLLDEGYLHKRGFHWYAYDTAADRLIDLSANEPSGVAGVHASIMATALDARNGLIYGLETPHGHLYRYDIARGVTTNLGRPGHLSAPYYNAGRYIWTDAGGRAYFTLAGINHVLYYDPVAGFGAAESWALRSVYFSDKCIRLGQWTPVGMRCYLADYEANFYLFDNRDRTFRHLGQGSGDARHYKDGAAFRIRVLDVAADERKIYFVNDDSELFSLFEFDVQTGATRRLCYLSDLDERLGGRTYFNRAGNDSWDRQGRFYIASFGGELESPTDVIVTRIDPIRLKSHLGL